MNKFYLHTSKHIEPLLEQIKVGDIIDFEMPSFCSGDYQAIVQEDKYGLFINEEDNYINSCRDFEILT